MALHARFFTTLDYLAPPRLIVSSRLQSTFPIRLLFVYSYHASNSSLEDPRMNATVIRTPCLSLLLHEHLALVEIY
ncbi:hypothetical protein M405DRAFT_809064 [Rhizopogon salebrosus TDB-379]|nr:hypothetical protein M405DRAFT_809064 [Rhizopogon salebrosus TDB-379]